MPIPPYKKLFPPHIRRSTLLVRIAPRPANDNNVMDHRVYVTADLSVPESMYMSSVECWGPLQPAAEQSLRLALDTVLYLANGINRPAQARELRDYLRRLAALRRRFLNPRGH